MTISEIKKLTKYLTDEEVDKIKNEIKSKESVLKSENLDEEEMIQVLNTLFAILVIERTLETEIEDIDDIRDELEKELLESYEIYDTYMAKYKKEEKKQKKNWLLNFLFLSDKIHSNKENLGISQKELAALKNELNNLRQQKSNENLAKVVKDKNGKVFGNFCDYPRKCNNPQHHHDSILNEHLREIREERLLKHIIEGKIDREKTIKTSNNDYKENNYDRNSINGGLSTDNGIQKNRGRN